MKQRTNIMLDGGTVAKLGGRYCFPNQYYIDIFYVEKDIKYTSTSGDVKILTPIRSWAEELTSTNLKKSFDNGKRGVVVCKDIWEQLRLADDVEKYNNRTSRFIGALDGYIDENDDDEEGDDWEDDDWEDDDKEDLDLYEEVEMANNNGKTELIMKKITTENKSSTMTMVSQAAIDAAKLTGAKKANEVIVGAITAALEKAGIPREFSEDEYAQVILKLMGPILIHYLADTQSEVINNLIGENSANRIKEGCKFATQAATAEVMEPLIAFMVPLLKELASGGLNTVISAATVAPASKEEPKGSLEPSEESTIFTEIDELEKKDKQKAPVEEVVAATAAS